MSQDPDNEDLMYGIVPPGYPDKFKNMIVSEEESYRIARERNNGGSVLEIMRTHGGDHPWNQEDILFPIELAEEVGIDPARYLQIEEGDILPTREEIALLEAYYEVCCPLTPLFYAD